MTPAAVAVADWAGVDRRLAYEQLLRASAAITDADRYDTEHPIICVRCGAPARYFRSWATKAGARDSGWLCEEHAK